MLPGGECWSVMKNLLCMAVLLLQLAFIQGTGAEGVDSVENSGAKNAAFHIGLYDEIGLSRKPPSATRIRKSWV